METDVGWVVLEDQTVLASCRIPSSGRDKAKGLLGTKSCEGAFVLEGAKAVHSVGMRYDLDVAFVSDKGEVLKIVKLKRNRFAHCRKASWVVEAEASMFSRWGLKVGQILELKR